MRGWLVIGAGAVLLVAALAIEAPATLLDRRAAGLSEGHVRIAAATGSVWRGSGELALVPDGTRVPIAWRLDPMSLLRGELAGSIVVDDARAPAKFAVGSQDFSVHDFSIALPAAAVLRNAGMPDAASIIGGTLLLEASDLARHDDRLEGRADLRWRDASLPGTQAGTRIALGELRIAAAGSGTEIPATISNSGGEVDVSGNLVLSMRALPKVDARIRPRAGLPVERAQAIGNALSSIGMADGTGGYHIVWPLLGR
ncbi:MAG TPA: type II secretion system protein N [Casimicrobiaceae bacterium]